MNVKSIMSGTMVFMAWIASVSFGGIGVSHTGTRPQWNMDGYDGVVLRRGTLTIYCDSIGNSVQVRRYGALLFVTELNPGGASYNFTYTFLDKSNLTDAVVFIGGNGHDVWLNDTNIAEDVYGNGGHDWLTCGLGRTKVHGGTGNDVIYLRSATPSTEYNQAFGDEGGDAIYGSNFNDFLAGGDNGDYLEGGPGDDYLTGGTGGDVLFGNQGFDRLVGGFDGIADLMSGGEGADRYSIYAYPGSHVNINGSLYDIEAEAIIDDGTDFREIVPMKTLPYAMDSSNLTEQDLGNAIFTELTIEAYGADSVFDPYLISFNYEFKPIVAESSQDPQFWLPPTITSMVNKATSPSIKKNATLRVKGW